MAARGGAGNSTGSAFRPFRKGHSFPINDITRFFACEAWPPHLLHLTTFTGYRVAANLVGVVGGGITTTQGQKSTVLEPKPLRVVGKYHRPGNTRYLRRSGSLSWAVVRGSRKPRRTGSRLPCLPPLRGGGVIHPERITLEYRRGVWPIQIHQRAPQRGRPLRGLFLRPPALKRGPKRFGLSALFREARTSVRWAIFAPCRPPLWPPGLTLCGKPVGPP